MSSSMSPEQIASYFIGEWKLISHDKNFDKYMRLQNIGTVLRKCAQYAPMRKVIERGHLDHSSGGFFFRDVTTIFKVITIHDEYSFASPQETKSGVLKQTIRGDKYESVCSFEKIDSIVKYKVERKREDGMVLRFSMDLNTKDYNQDAKQVRMTAILTATKDGKTEETHDIWEKEA